jgi:hypothetical protein
LKRKLEKKVFLFCGGGPKTQKRKNAKTQKRKNAKNAKTQKTQNQTFFFGMRAKEEYVNEE